MKATSEVTPSPSTPIRSLDIADILAFIYYINTEIRKSCAEGTKKNDLMLFIVLA